MKKIVKSQLIYIFMKRMEKSLFINQQFLKIGTFSNTKEYISSKIFLQKMSFTFCQKGIMHTRY